MKADDPKLVNTLKLGNGCLTLVDQSESELSTPPTESKYRQPGGGWKVAVLEILQALLAGSLTWEEPWKFAYHSPCLSDRQLYSMVNGWPSNLRLKNQTKELCSQRDGWTTGCGTTMWA